MQFISHLFYIYLIMCQFIYTNKMININLHSNKIILLNNKSHPLLITIYSLYSSGLLKPAGFMQMSLAQGQLASQPRSTPEYSLKDFYHLLKTDITVYNYRYEINCYLVVVLTPKLTTSLRHTSRIQLHYFFLKKCLYNELMILLMNIYLASLIFPKTY